jgi:hypothetical protein
MPVATARPPLNGLSLLQRLRLTIAFFFAVAVLGGTESARRVSADDDSPRAGAAGVVPAPD